MGSNNVRQHFFKGAMLLTIAGMIGKVLSAGYRIPLQNIAGDVGFYIYQQVYPFLGMAWMISIYGFPVAISTLVAERRMLSMRGFFVPVFLLLISISLVLCGLLYGGAPFIATFMGDEGLVMPLRVSALVFLFLPFTSILRGTFQGLQDMGPTAYSQITEQLVRVVVIVFATVYLVGGGYSLYHVGAGAAFGSIVGAMVAIGVLGAFAVKRLPSSINEQRPIPFRNIIRTVFMVGLFICLNYMLLLFIQLGDALTMVAQLKDYGYSLEKAKEWKGVFDRGYPLIQLGTVIGSSFALSLVPSLTKQRLENKRAEAYADAHSAIKFSFIFSAAAAVGLVLVLPEVNVLFFNSRHGTETLQVLAVLVLFGSLALTYSSLLQGLGRMKTPAVMVLLGFVVKVFLNIWLIPMYGITGGAISSVTAIMVVWGGNALLLYRTIRVPFINSLPWKAITMSLLALISTVLAGKWVMETLFTIQTRLDYLWYTISIVSAGIFVTMLVLLRMNVFTEDELYALPFGGKLIWLWKRR